MIRSPLAKLALMTSVIGFLLMGLVGTSAAQKKYAPGVTDKEIKIGQTNPYSGPVSFAGANGKGDVAYTKWINDQGGINGRKINLISLDDGYVPAKTLEQTRKLVEQENVAFIYKSLGTGPNSAIAKYLNDRKVPHIFLSTGAAKFYTPAETPWLVPYYLRYVDEARITASNFLRTMPNAKIAILYQHDDFGKDFLEGIKEALGPKAATMIVKEATFEVQDPSVDSQIISLAESKADILYLASVPGRPVTQAIRKSHDLGWKPIYVLPSTTNVVDVILKPAGLEKAVGSITVAFLKDPLDPGWKDDSEVKAWHAWVDKYLPGSDKTNTSYRYAFYVGAKLKHVLEACGNDLTRENILKQATNMKNLRFPLLLPGIAINTSPTDYRPLEQMQLFRFDGQRWVPHGGVTEVGN